MATMPLTREERRAQLIVRRRTQVERLERKIRALVTRAATARRSLAALERAALADAPALAAVAVERAAAVAAQITERRAARLTAAAQREEKQHFRVHGDADAGFGSVVRVICRNYPGGITGRSLFLQRNTLELRADAVVSCPACMVLKDCWLEQPKRKPITIRRRAMLQALAMRRTP